MRDAYKNAFPRQSTSVGCHKQAGFGSTVLGEDADFKLASIRILYEDCDVPRPIWTRDPDFTTTAIVAFVVQTGFYSLRIAAKFLRLGTWGWDDGSCAVAYVRGALVLVAEHILVLC